MGEKKMSREAIAALEVGRTEIDKGLSIGVTLFFLLCIFLVPLAQLRIDQAKITPVELPVMRLLDRQEGEGFFDRIEAANNEVLRSIDHLESSLEEDSFLKDLFLPSLQYLYVRYLGQGNEKVVLGRDGWLFYRPGVDALIGQPFLDVNQLNQRKEGHEVWEKPVLPDPLAAIAHFRDQLAEKGIDLLVVPVPIKPSIHPEKLSARGVSGELSNRSWHAFLKKLESEGIHYFDARPVLQKYAKEYGSAYLPTDTHWLPDAMERVAAQLSMYIVEHGLVEKKNDFMELYEVDHVGEGDIHRMLTLPEEPKLFVTQRVEIKQLLTGEGEFWQPDRTAEVLLLGDSFTNIYSTAGLGWGEGGGFAEHLSYNLQQPLDLLARNDGGAYATREMLATEMRRGRDRLAGKRLVIWQFAERELGLGNWKKIDLSLGESHESGFYVVESGVQVEVTGTVASISRSPRPGSVPYRDNIVTLHLVDMQGKEPLEYDQALIYGFGMRDNRLTPLAGLRPNDTVALTLSSWDDVEMEYGSYRRSPLSDEMMELELPNWGTIDDETTN